MSTTQTRTTPTADELGEMVDRGESIEHFFAGNGKMIHPDPNDPVTIIVTADFPPALYTEMEELSIALNMSHSDLIKSFVREALDRHYLASAAAAQLRKPASPPPNTAKAA